MPDNVVSEEDKMPANVMVEEEKTMVKMAEERKPKVEAKSSGASQKTQKKKIANGLGSS